MVTRLDKLIILGIELHICCLITREMIDKCNYFVLKLNVSSITGVASFYIRKLMEY